MTKRTITWLHLSDLHARIRDDWDSRKITDTLVQDLKTLQKDQGLRPDFLFFTGDAAFGAAANEKMADQYKMVASFFDAVRSAFQPEIPVRDVYLVPGNHDVDRGEITPDQTDWLRHKDRELKEILFAMRDSKKQWRTWMDRLNGYRNFVTSYGLLHLKPDDPHLIWADAREISGLRVGIAGLNSAWSCSDDDDKAKLWCGAEWQVAKIKEQMGPVDFAFALLHHPGNWFTAHEDPAVMRGLRDEFPIVLHGHEHQEWIDVSDQRRLIVSAGACYDSSWMPNGFSIGQLDVDQYEANIRLRQWDRTGGGWVPREIAKRTKNGIWTVKDIPWLNAALDASETPSPDTSRLLEEESKSLSAEDHYTRRFCQHVIEQYDILELFGCDIPRELQRHQLSVAYVSLNLSPESDEEETGHLPTETHSEDEEIRSGFKSPLQSKDGSTLSMARLLERDNRLIIRGPAGAGKSTLLRWCCINAAQDFLTKIGAESSSGFAETRINDEPLKSIKEHDSLVVSQSPPKVPILIRLRDCPNGKLPSANDLPRFLAKHLPSPPSEWMTRILESGSAIVLFDGVDEIHRDTRAQLAEEIRELIATYPKCTYVVTTRPGAVERGWLDRLQFVEARVEPMSRADREQFIDKWYTSAALELKHRPRPGEDLTKTARQLKTELVDQPEIGLLGSNPLLCAMICALYRERQERLPETPAELCEALVQMLLHRRERETPGLLDAHFLLAWRLLQYPQKKGLLADLAWRMVTKGESSLSVDDAKIVVAAALGSTPGRKEDEASEVLQAIVERSGLLRPAGDGRVDFLHNTLKEYLAAGRIVEEGDWEHLITRADDPAWQPVILFSLALAPASFSSGLVRGLVDRIPSNKPARRKSGNLTKAERVILAEESSREFFLVRCRSAAKRLAAELSESVDALTDRLFPPAYMSEVETLAQLGPRILMHGAARLCEPGWWIENRYDVRLLSRCLRLLRLIGGQRSASALKCARKLPGFSSLLTSEWMMACTELCQGTLPWPFHTDRVDLRNTRVFDLQPLRQLQKVRVVDLGWSQVSDLDALSHLKPKSLNLAYTNVRSISPLAEMLSLEVLILDGLRLKDYSPLAKLTNLKRLDLDRTGFREFTLLAPLSSLETLYLVNNDIRDVTPLAQIASLKNLILSANECFGGLGSLVALPLLKVLDVKGCRIPDEAIAEFKAQRPNVSIVQ